MALLLEQLTYSVCEIMNKGEKIICLMCCSYDIVSIKILSLCRHNYSWATILAVVILTKGQESKMAGRKRRDSISYNNVLFFPKEFQFFFRNLDKVSKFQS